MVVMDLPRIAYTIACAFALVMLLSTGARRAWPRFGWYLLAALVCSVLPRNEALRAWWETWWVAESAVALLLLLSAVEEYFSAARTKMFVRECNALRNGCRLTAISGAVVCFAFAPAPADWLMRIVAGKELAYILLAGALILVTGWLIGESVDLPRHVKRHGIMLSLLASGQAAALVCNPSTGLARMPDDSRAILAPLSWLFAAACIVIWGLAVAPISND